MAASVGVMDAGCDSVLPIVNGSTHAAGGGARRATRKGIWKPGGSTRQGCHGFGRAGIRKVHLRRLEAQAWENILDAIHGHVGEFSGLQFVQAATINPAFASHLLDGNPPQQIRNSFGYAGDSIACAVRGAGINSRYTFAAVAAEWL